jgi:RsiW-degrading membrane proteinase PrsW (M82 family)
MPGSLVAMTAAVFMALLAVLTGCDGHLVGTRDVELDYRVGTAGAPLDAGAAEVGRPAPRPRIPPARGLAGGHGAPLATDPSVSKDELRERVNARVHAADVAIDLETGEGASKADSLEISVDEASVEEVDALVTWSGGLKLYVLDPDAAMEPKRLEELTPESEVGPSGETHRTFTGPPPAVSRAVHATPAEGGHRLLVEASPGALARTRVADDPAVYDLRDGITSATAKGSSLRLEVTPEARADLAAAAALQPGPVAFVRDASILAVATLEETLTGAGLTLHLGSSPRAYTRAEAAAKLLGTKPLPHLVRTQVTRKPPVYTLAIAEVTLPFLLSLAWLAFVRRFDRARPEPLWLVLVTFGLGGAAVVPVSVVEWRLGEASAYTNPQLMTYGGQLSAFPIAFAVYVLTVGLVEEGAKLFAAWAVARQRREFDEPVDGIIYASAAALGFAALENVRYFAAGRVAGGLVVTRAFMSAPAHFLFASIWGYALGQRLVDPRRRVWPFFLASVLAHGLFDTCLSFPATAHLGPLVNFALASVFVVMLRKALRHGPVEPSGPREPRGRLDVFPVGSRALFALFVLALHASAALVFFLGVYVEQTHDRIGPPFILASTTLVAILGMTAYGVSASLPLDVVLDDAGATFAGAFLAWRQVTRVERKREAGAGDRLILAGHGARLALGPVDPRSADNLVATVRARMARAASRDADREKDERVGPPA